MGRPDVQSGLAMITQLKNLAVFLHITLWYLVSIHERMTAVVRSFEFPVFLE